MAFTRPPEHYMQCGLTDRVVGAARARALRKRGEEVRFDHYTVRGKARYRWIAACPRDPHVARWISARAVLVPWGHPVPAQGQMTMRQFVDDVERKLVKAFAIPPEMLSAGPRLSMPAPEGWLG